MNEHQDDQAVAEVLAADPEAITAGPGRATDLFRFPAFRRLWIGTLISSFGQLSERLAVSWFVFEATGSALLTGLVATAQYAQNIVFGPIAGAVSDRYPRNRIIAVAMAAKVGAVLAIAILVRSGYPSFVLLFALITLSAIAGTFSGASSLQTLAGDLVGPSRRARAVSVMWGGQRAIGAIGAITSGFLIAWAGVAASVFLSASMLTIAAIVYLGVADPRKRPPAGRHSLVADTVEGLRMVRHEPMLATLLGLAAAAEIFGFSYTSLLPALAERVLHVGAVGFGTLSAVASVGAVIATIALAGAGERVRHGLLLILVFAAFGSLLIALGGTQVYLLAVAIALGLGACTALVDTLEVIMVQSTVDDRRRGRALGAWNAAFGLGWVGPIILGAIADTLGLSTALTFAGGVLLAIAAVTAIRAPRLRRG